MSGTKLGWSKKCSACGATHHVADGSRCMECHCKAQDEKREREAVAAKERTDAIRTTAEAETVAAIVAFIEAKAAKKGGYTHAIYGDSCAHCEWERALESIADQVRDGDWRPKPDGRRG